MGRKSCGAIAKVYYWKARPGKLDDYHRYIKTVGEPVDFEAQRAGAFLSITTYISHASDSPWTHMRIFVLKDREQAASLEKALDDAVSGFSPMRANARQTRIWRPRCAIR